MVRRFVVAMLLAAVAVPAQTRSCVGTSSVGAFRILVSSPGGSNPLPVRSINNIAANSKITYEPIQLPDNLKKNGKLAIVAVPADPDQRGVQGAVVLDSKPAGATGEWTAPFRIGTLLIAFAPQGLDEKRIANLVSRDEDLIDDLARYAEHTVELENTIEALSLLDAEDEAEPEPGASSSATPVEQALLTLTRALNPSSTYFNPLTGGPTVGPQTRTGMAAGLFFENAGGLFPGGGALSMAKTWLMPDSEFRTVYAESASGDGLTLCAQKTFARSRNRIVYLWGYQLTSASAPKFAQGANTSIPAGARSTIAVKTPNRLEWPLLNRVREWTLVNTDNNRETPVRIRTTAARGWAEIDLRKTAVEPGAYKLKGRWDWEAVQVDGIWRVSAPGDLAKARLTPESARQLVENSGMVPIEIEGTDFQFVERVSLKRAGKLGAINTPLEFRLPDGFRGGTQNKLELEINTDTFHAGSYLLAVQQINGKSQDIPVQILPVPPRISNLPIRVNTGEAQPQRITLRGAGLDRLEAGFDTPEGLRVQMLDGSDNERDAMVTIAAALKLGSKVRTATGGLVFQIAGPRPRIVAVTVALPEDLPADLRDGELPSGSQAAFTLKANNVEAPATLTIDCAEPARSLGALRIRLGERKSGVKFDSAGPGAFYAALDPGLVSQSGCTLTAVLETDSAGASAAYTLGRVVRLPRIDALTWTEEKSAGGFMAILRGADLELIDKAGWEGQPGLLVTNAPKSVAGDVQSLRVVLPWPPPSPLAPVQIWLRGDAQGRKTSIRKHSQPDK